MSHARNEWLRDGCGGGTGGVRCIISLERLGFFTFASNFLLRFKFLLKKILLFSSLYWRCIFYDGLWVDTGLL